MGPPAPDDPHDGGDDGGGDAGIDAGDFVSWLSAMAGALGGEGGMDVPCGACTACCTSSQFVHVEPDETDALAHIPRELLFPAPGRPTGHVLLGFDGRGHCPMLVDGACSIYEHRPRTCRTYDCRVFAASGLDPADDAKPLIAARSARWRFRHPTAADVVTHDAVRAAATYLRAHAAELPSGAVPATVTQQAVLAVELHSQFLRDDGTGPAVVTPDLATVQVALRRPR
jgi:hypothetical protein